MGNSAHDLARRLAQNAEAVCRHYLSNGRRSGRYWVVGDIMNTPGHSMYVRLFGPEAGKGAAGKWTDTATTEHGDLLDIIAKRSGISHFPDIAAEALRFLGSPEADARASSMRPDSPIDPSKYSESARRLEDRMVTSVLILGANGGLARNTSAVFLARPGVAVTLYLRRAGRLPNPDPARVTMIEGDVLDIEKLRIAMAGQDVVYANPAGDMASQARAIIQAMHATGLKRLIFVSSMGIYGEVPGEKYRKILDPYRDSAFEIEASDLVYTILRPGWFTDEPEVSYQLTQKGEPFKGHDVSLNSLSDLIVKLALTPGLHIHQSLGLSRK